MDIASSGPVRDRLLTTKLYIPPRRSELVPRPRLIERLSEGLSRQLTLICTPAGFGKTTLLSEWLSIQRAACGHSQLAIGWVSLDAEDNDPMRFWHYVVTALDLAQPGVGESTLDALFAAQPASIPSLLTTFINTIASSAHDFALVLDDYHVIQAQAIHDTVASLLEHLPPNMHLFIASRTEPPLALARLRARNQLVELRSSDLRFTHAEAALFLQHILDVRLSVEEVAALEERTEGWIAGLQLAALSMRGRPDLSTFIASFAGSHRYIVDYLAEEVLYRLPETVQTFLMRTSILDRLCASLCNALTDQVDGQRTLEALEQANVFIFPLDEERRWYRYHHLFAEVLSHRLQRLHPDLAPELHRRASVWCEEHDQMEAAVEHALCAHDFERTVYLIEQKEAGELVTNRGEFGTLQRWMEALPYGLVRARPRLCLIYIWSLLPLGRWNECERLLQDAERGLQAVSEPAIVERVLSSIMAARASLAYSTGNAQFAISLSEQALARIPPENLSGRSFTLLHLAGAYWAGGDLATANKYIEQAVTMGRAAGNIYVTLFSMYLLAMVQVSQAHLHQADSTFQQALQFAASYQERPLMATASLRLDLGRLLYEWNDLDATVEHVNRSIEIYLQIGDPRFLPYAYRTLAAVKRAQGDGEGEREELERALHLLRQHNLARDNPLLAAFGARLSMLLGDIEAAERWAREDAGNGDEQPVYLHETKHLIRTRLFMQQGKTAAALEMLGCLLHMAEAEARTGSVIKILVLLAMALQMQGDNSAAALTLARALTLAEPEGYIRTFVDEGEPMRTLLSEVLAAQQEGRFSGEHSVSSTYIQRLLAAFAVPSVPSLADNGNLPALSSLLAEPLSERELEVLRLIAAGLSNQEITEQLVIAMSTLKTHINHLYSKLDVRSRTQAIIQARALNLL
jgi:LuxR family maltose regulon positive regulatory protein